MNCLDPYGQHVIQTIHAAAATAGENERLKIQLHNAQLKEEAYSQAFSSVDKRTWFFGKSGPMMLLSTSATCCRRTELQPPFPQSVIYEIKLYGVDDWVLFNEADYLDDKKLVERLEARPFVEVFRRGSLRQTASLIRNAFSKVMENGVAQYFCGWEKEGNTWAFHTFHAFTTHRTRGTYEPQRGSTALSAAGGASVVHEFRACFCQVRDPLTRWLLLGFYHAAFLYSLLLGMGFPIPQGLYLYTRDSGIEDFLLKSFAWFGDHPLSLDDSPVYFRQEVLDRKDQPLLVHDCRRTARSAENVRYLEETMASGRVYRPREKDSYPLRALPVIVANTPSAFSCNPSVLVLELDRSDFSGRPDASCPGAGKDTAEYLQLFAHYVTGQIHWLEEELKEGMRQAGDCGCELSLEARNTMGVLLGVNRFVGRFWNSVHVPDAARFGETEFAGLGEMMEELSCKDCGSDVVEQFLLLAAAMIREGRLTGCRTDRAPAGDAAKDHVFFGEGNVYFPMKPFRNICRQLGRSTPVAAHALLLAGVCTGKPASDSSLMTRVTICNVYGQRRSLTVYRIGCGFLEPDGEPPLFDEEGDGDGN